MGIVRCIILFFIILFSIVTAHGQERYSKKGHATFYADKFEGRRTASGEKFSQMAFTAAHRTLPMGTWVKVTNLSSQRAVVVRINDRGPFGRGRIIDLSKRAALEIGMLSNGKSLVLIEVVDYPQAESFLLRFAPALDNRGIIREIPKISPKPVL